MKNNKPWQVLHCPPESSAPSGPPARVAHRRWSARRTVSLSSLLAFPFSHQPTRPSCSSHVPGRRRRGATAVLGGGKQSPGPDPRPGKLRRARELPGEGSSSRMAPRSWAGAGRASSSRFQLKPGSTNRPSALGRV